MLDLRAQDDTFAGFIQGCVEVHAHVDVGDLVFGSVVSFFDGGHDGNFCALLEDYSLRRHHDHRKVLRVEAPCANLFGDGVGEAVVLARAIEFADEFLRDS